MGFIIGLINAVVKAGNLLGMLFCVLLAYKAYTEGYTTDGIFFAIGAVFFSQLVGLEVRVTELPQPKKPKKKECCGRCK